MSTTIPENEGRERLLDLKPMNLQDILVRTFRIYMKRPMLFFGIVAVIGGIPMAVFETSIIVIYKSVINQAQPGGISPGFLLNVEIWGVLVIISLLFNLFLQTVATGGIVHAVRMIFLDRKVSLGNCLKAVWPSSWKICMARAWAGLIYLSLIIIYLLTILYATNKINENENSTIDWTIIMLLIWLAINIFLIIISLKYLFIPQIIIMENPHVVGTLKRSWGLISGFFWKAMGVAFIINLILFTTSLLFDCCISYAGDLFAVIPGINPNAGLALLLVFHTLFSLFTYPLSLIAYTLVYFNIRVVREGFNLESLNKSVGGDFQSTEASLA
jgi:hypothetical protein